MVGSGQTGKCACLLHHAHHADRHTCMCNWQDSPVAAKSSSQSQRCTLPSYQPHMAARPAWCRRGCKGIVKAPSPTHPHLAADTWVHSDAHWCVVGQIGCTHHCTAGGGVPPKSAPVALHSRPAEGCPPIPPSPPPSHPQMQ